MGEAIVILTVLSCAAKGLSFGFFAKHESTKERKSSDHSPPERRGESFCAMWYKALIAFMLNSGGLRSAKN